MKINKKKSYSTRKKTLLMLVTVALLLVSVFAAYKFSRPNEDIVSPDLNAKTTSVAPTAQDNFTDGTERDPGNSLSEGEGSGSINDKQGEISSMSDKSKWIKSSSGEISVYNPTNNSLIISGNEISGESTLSVVSFRIIDDLSGVIGEGQLVVKNGKFSGSLDFTSSASEGRIDIFATKEDGREYSNIEIPVKLK